MRFCSEIQFFAIFNGMRAIFLAEAYNNGGPHHSLIHRRIRIKFFRIGPGILASVLVFFFLSCARMRAACCRSFFYRRHACTADEANGAPLLLCSPWTGPSRRANGIPGGDGRAPAGLRRAPGHNPPAPDRMVVVAARARARHLGHVACPVRPGSPAAAPRGSTTISDSA